MRIDADQWIGPETIAGVNFFNLATNIGGANLSERAGKALIVGHEGAIEVEHVHVMVSGDGNCYFGVPQD